MFSFASGAGQEKVRPKGPREEAPRPDQRFSQGPHSALKLANGPARHHYRTIWKGTYASRSS